MLLRVGGELDLGGETVGVEGFELGVAGPFAADPFDQLGEGLAGPLRRFVTASFG